MTDAEVIEIIRAYAQQKKYVKELEILLKEAETIILKLRGI